jgi:hypothetical protein
MLPAISSGALAQGVSPSDAGIANRHWLPYWDVPEFDFNWGPILGGSYQEWQSAVPRSDGAGGPEQTVSTRILSLEGGVRLSLDHLPIYRTSVAEPDRSEKKELAPAELATSGSSLTITMTPSAGYAFGKIFSLENENKDAQATAFSQAPANREGTYHRALAATKVTAFYRMMRYSVGVNYGGIFGDEAVGAPRSQIELVQDFGLRTTKRSSLHLTPTLGRVFEESLSDYGLQYTDLWFHLLVGPFFSAVLDFGPGVAFDWRPSLSTGSSSSYFKANFSWDIFGPFAIAANGRYEIDVLFDRPDQATLLGGSPERDPLQDLGAPASHVSRESDELTVLLFVGLKGVLLGWSVGYLSLHDVKNAFERNGVRETGSSQGFGVCGQSAF